MPLFSARRNQASQVYGGQIDTSFSISESPELWSADPSHKLLTHLSACDVDNPTPTSRQLVKLSRLLYSNLSIYNSAIDIHARLVGQPTVGGDISPATAAIASRFLQEVPLLSEFQPYISDRKGMGNLCRDMVRDVLRDGQGFIQDRFAQEEDGLGDGYVGLLRFNPLNFAYEQTHWGYVLTYRSMQYPRIDEDGNPLPSPFFHVLKLEEDSNDLWGVPLVNGGTLLVEILTSMLVAIQLQTMRFANPPSFTVISQKNLDAFKDGPIAQIFADRIKALQSKVNEALRYMRKGKAVELVTSLPGDVDLQSKIFGQGFANFIDHDTLWKIAILCANTLGVPPALLGIKTSGAGIASDEFSVSYTLLSARVGSIREMLRPMVRQTVRNYLTNARVSPREIDRIEISFGDLDLVSPQDRAKIDKTEAERLEILNRIWLEIYAVDPDQAEAFAQTHNFSPSIR